MTDQITDALARRCHEARREVHAGLPSWDATPEAERVVLKHTVEFWNELDTGSLPINDLVASTVLAWEGHSMRYLGYIDCSDLEIRCMLTTYLALRTVGFTP